MTWRVSEECQRGVQIRGCGIQRGLQATFRGGGGLGAAFGGVSDKGSEWKECMVVFLLEGAQNKRYSEVSPELGGGQSPKNAEGVQGWNWKNSEMLLEWRML